MSGAWSNAPRWVAWPLMAILITTIVACVKIQTGQTEQEAKESAARRGAALKAEWAEQLNRTPVEALPEIYLTYLEETATTYLGFGEQLLGQWRQGELASDTAIPSSSIREVTERWLETERPLVRAWEDNIEYGLEYLRDTRQFSPELIGDLEDARDVYYGFYTSILYPQRTSQEYSSELDHVRAEVDRIGREFRQKWL